MLDKRMRALGIPFVKIGNHTTLIRLVQAIRENQPMPKPTVCLSMIVKNEAHVIRRCLESVLPMIDSYVIHDTGSTDETISIIRETVGHLPGGVVSVPWVNFSHNRNLTLEDARSMRDADYVLFMDADDVLVLEDGIPQLGDANCYNVEIRSSYLSYHRTLIVSTKLESRWVGAIHECLDVPNGKPKSLTGVFVHSSHEGARSNDPAKYRRDALLLEQERIEKPDDPRTLFYLAQSWKDAGEFDLALRYYRARAEMEHGWIDERWFSLYQIGRILHGSGAPWVEAQNAYLKAWQFMPYRAEPLYHLGMHYQQKQEWVVSHLFLSRAALIPRPSLTSLFIEPQVYDYLVPLEFGVACFYVGHYGVAAQAFRELLGSTSIDLDQRDLIERNLQFAIDEMGERQAA